MVENDNSILLTEDGNPIGQVVMAEGPLVVDRGANDRAVTAVTEDIVRRTAQTLTGSLDADESVADFFPGFNDDTKREKALYLFVSGGKTLDEIAREVGVPSRTVSQWMYLGQWDNIARREIAARQSESVLALARLRAERRLVITQEQLEQAKEIRDKAANDIKSDKVSLKSGTEAWAAAAKVEQTLTGVSEAGTIADINGQGSEEKKESSGKTPLVMVFQGGLPPRREDIIDV